MSSLDLPYIPSPPSLVGSIRHHSGHCTDWPVISSYSELSLLTKIIMRPHALSIVSRSLPMHKEGPEDEDEACVPYIQHAVYRKLAFPRMTDVQTYKRKMRLKFLNRTSWLTLKCSATIHCQCTIPYHTHYLLRYSKVESVSTRRLGARWIASMQSLS